MRGWHTGWGETILLLFLVMAEATEVEDVHAMRACATAL